MKLGIHVNTNRHMTELLSIASAAVERGHGVSVFLTSEGVGLLTEKRMSELASIDGVDVSFCDYVASRMGIVRDELAEQIRAGSQLDNAIMVRDSDRVISL